MYSKSTSRNIDKLSDDHTLNIVFHKFIGKTFPVIVPHYCIYHTPAFAFKSIGTISLWWPIEYTQWVLHAREPSWDMPLLHNTKQYSACQLMGNESHKFSWWQVMLVVVSYTKYVHGHFLLDASKVNVTVDLWCGNIFSSFGHSMSVVSNSIAWI